MLVCIFFDDDIQQQHLQYMCRRAGEQSAKNRHSLIPQNFAQVWFQTISSSPHFGP